MLNVLFCPYFAMRIYQNRWFLNHIRGVNVLFLLLEMIGIFLELVGDHFKKNGKYIILPLFMGCIPLILPVLNLSSF